MLVVGKDGHIVALTGSKRFYFTFSLLWRDIRLEYISSHISFWGTFRIFFGRILNDLQHNGIETFFSWFFIHSFTVPALDSVQFPLTVEIQGKNQWVSRKATSQGILSERFGGKIEYDFIRDTSINVRIWDFDSFSPLFPIRTSLSSCNNSRHTYIKVDETFDPYSSKEGMKIFKDCIVNSGISVYKRNSLEILKVHEDSSINSWPSIIPIEDNFGTKVFEYGEIGNLRHAIFLGASSSWYHFIIDDLPIYIEVGKTHNQDIPVVLPAGLPEPIIELINLAGFRKHFFLPAGFSILVQELEMPTYERRRDTSLFPFDGLKLEVLQNFFNSLYFTNGLENTITKRAKKILIKRPTNTLRKISDFQNLEELLIEKGFTSLSPENLELSQQISLFRNADILVSQGGAALTSLLFCRPGTSIIELLPWGVREYPFWESFAKQLNLRHKTVISKKRKLLTFLSPDPKLKFNFKEILDLLENQIDDF